MQCISEYIHDDEEDERRRRSSVCWRGTSLYYSSRDERNQDTYLYISVQYETPRTVHDYVYIHAYMARGLKMRSNEELLRQKLQREKAPPLPSSQ